MQQSINMHRT